MDAKALKKLLLKPEFWLIVLCVGVLLLRVMLSFLATEFNYDSYFSLRQVEHIKSTGLPLYQDPLSYSGKTQLFAPLFYYILAFFSLVIPLEIVAKVIPNIFAVLIMALVYFMSLKIKF